MSRTRNRHVQLHLPTLSGQEACRLVHVLERMIRAIWKTHGEEMGEVIDLDPLDAMASDRARSNELLSNPARPDEASFDDADIPF